MYGSCREELNLKTQESESPSKIKRRQNSREWRRNTYDKQGYADNHVPSSFLKAYHYENPTPCSLAALFVDSLAVVQQTNICLGVYLVFVWLTRNPVKILLLKVLLQVLAAAALSARLFSQSLEFQKILQLTGKGLLGGMILMAVSPVLRTLTEAYSLDTVQNLTMLAGFVHLTTYDYRYSTTVSTKLECTVSLSCSFFMSLLLASRLRGPNADTTVFLFLTVCTLAFVLLPTLLHQWKQKFQSWPRVLYVLPNLLQVGLCVHGVNYLFNSWAAFLFCGFVLVVVGVCPLLVYIMLPQKRQIRGPWELGGVMGPEALKKHLFEKSVQE